MPKQTLIRSPENQEGSSGRDEHVERLLVRLFNVPADIAQEISTMPADVTDKLFQYFELCVRYGFDSRQVAVFRADNEGIHPLFDKYASHIRGKVIKSWKRGS